MARQRGGVVAAPARAHAVRGEVGAHNLGAGAERELSPLDGAAVPDGPQRLVGARAHPVAARHLSPYVLRVLERGHVVEL